MSSLEPQSNSEVAAAVWDSEKWAQNGPVITFGPDLKPVWIKETEAASGKEVIFKAGFLKTEIGENTVEKNELPYYEITTVSKDQNGNMSYALQGPKGLRFYSESDVRVATENFASVVNSLTERSQLSYIGWDADKKEFKYNAPTQTTEH